MLTVPVTIDSRLRIDGNLLGHDLVNEIFDDLTVRNPAREYAEKARKWGWEKIPEHFILFDMEGDTVVLPRGYAVQLRKKLRANDRRVLWDNQTVWVPGEEYGRDEFEYRLHQPEAVRQTKRHRQGIYKAPTGSGKTVTFCGFLWQYHPEFSLILVDKSDLVQQWIDRLRDHIGLDEDEIGVIGGGKWRERRITVATVQTLSRALRGEDEGKQDKAWDVLQRASFLLLDECHHATAETYQEVVELSPARVRVGTSATPDKSKTWKIARQVLGEVYYEDDEEELTRMGVLEKPHVEVIHTSFWFDYHGDMLVEYDDECPIEGCKNEGSTHRHHNNYKKALDALINDVARNKRIVNKIAANRGHKQLIVTDEIRHIDAMMTELYADHAHLDMDEGIVRTLKGKGMTKKQRQAVIDWANQADECILFSTVAGEGLDIPSLDRIHLPWPTGNPRKTEQEIGRGRRVHEGKLSTIIYDYADTEVKVFAKQFKKRLYKCYMALGIEVRQ